MAEEPTRRVFISWSGDRSRIVAEAMLRFVGDLVQAAEPWASFDIEAGKRWNEEIVQRLSESEIGICVVMPENVHAPWLNFEAGAIAGKLRLDSRVICFLVGISKSEIPYPLASFQLVEATHEGSLALARSVNIGTGGTVDDDRLVRTHGWAWKDLEIAVTRALQEAGGSNEVQAGASESDINEVIVQRLIAIEAAVERLRIQSRLSFDPRWRTQGKFVSQGNTMSFAEALDAVSRDPPDSGSSAGGGEGH